MSVKSAPRVAPKSASKPQDDSQIQVARISSSTSIQVTKAQVIGTVAAALLTLFGVAIANLDKFGSKPSPPPVNRLQVESNIQRVRDLFEDNQKDAETVETIVLTEKTISAAQKKIVNRLGNDYRLEHQRRMKRFNEEKIILDHAVETNNWEVIDSSKQRLIQITHEDASHLDETFHQVDRTIHLLDTDPKAKTKKTAEEQTLEDLMKRRRGDEVAKLLPIKDQSAPKRTDLFYDGEAPLYYALPYFKDNSEDTVSRVVPPFETDCAEKTFKRFSFGQESFPRPGNRFLFITTLELPVKKNFQSGIIEVGTLHNSECLSGSFECVSVKPETTLRGEHHVSFGSTTLSWGSFAVRRDRIFGLFEPATPEQSKITSEQFECLPDVTADHLLFNAPKSAPMDKSGTTYRLNLKLVF